MGGNQSADLGAEARAKEAEIREQILAQGLTPTSAGQYQVSLFLSGEAHDSGVCPQRARCSGRRASVQRPSVLVSQVGASVRS